jgi:hypothetical protein
MLASSFVVFCCVILRIAAIVLPGVDLMDEMDETVKPEKLDDKMTLTLR